MIDAVFTNPPEMRRIGTVHFIGIGGSGMCGIAEVLLTQGYTVTGSDINSSNVTNRLEKLGARVFIGHDSRNISHADVVVCSSAIKSDNPELAAAKQCRLPVIRRAEMLAEIMRYRHGIAVAGTHGKTTTTSLVASILAEDGKDPTFIIGGILNSAGSNAKLGASRYLVAEADESDVSFLHLQPMTAIITNIDADHLESYEGDFERLKNAFVEFVHNLPFYGLAVVCIDDPVVREILPRLSRPVFTYGVSNDADFRISDIISEQFASEFTVERPDSMSSITVRLNAPGHHNILNATAAIAVASDERVADTAIRRALNNFEGVGRRFQLHGEYKVGNGSALLVDDYGHHPREIAAVIQAARSGWPDRRLVMIYQPHRYTRTRDLYEDFVAVLSEVDVLVLLDVYSAGEPLIVGADGRSLARSIRQRGKVEPVFVEELDDVPLVVRDLVHAGDLVLAQGAGSVGRLAKELADRKLQ